LSVGITQDGIITEDERNCLKVFISDFIDKKTSTNIDFDEIAELKKEMTLPGICPLNPCIEFKEKLFCFTGISKQMKRKDFEKQIVSLGGLYNDNVIKETNYLIVGSNGNPCWAYSCYGRKVEKAIDMRKRSNEMLFCISCNTNPFHFLL